MLNSNSAASAIQNPEANREAAEEWRSDNQQIDDLARKR
jgi:hypothetical protein